MNASTLAVLAPAAFSIALDAVAEAFANVSGCEISMIYGPASGASPNSIESRIADAGSFDVVFLPKGLMTKGSEAGKINPASIVEVMSSCIGVCARNAGGARQIDTVADFIAMLLASSRIAVSAAGSGLYVSQVLLKRLGLEQALKDRLQIIDGEPVATAVKRGEADVGIQQMAELLHVEGIAILGPVPEELQSYTVISGGVSAETGQAENASRFLRFFSTSVARAALESGGVASIK